MNFDIHMFNVSGVATKYLKIAFLLKKLDLTDELDM